MTNFMHISCFYYKDDCFLHCMFHTLRGLFFRCVNCILSFPIISFGTIVVILRQTRVKAFHFNTEAN